ncbi:amino acid ABC transporter permease [Flexivirga caeni]|uniref:Amino acid ABC transporter permease n=1 Tax=Flexivirga caeni TaxID=2294115 RepID=A0A3M9MGE9_9MICO|nr:amino acid ABC transporter permease [Flexivirga caeni]RNI24265.1 amino acid ABC transporter permease [Flexivirga caeni]
MHSNAVSVISDAMPLLLKGLWWTAALSALSIAFATVIGVIVGLMRISGNIVVRGISTVYVNVFRCTPLLVQILFLYFGLPELLNFSWSPEVAGVATLSLNIGAYVGEVVRGGVQAIGRGQTEAGRAIGLSRGLTMRLVVLPQAFRQVIPSYINQCTICVKDSSLLSVIGVAELTMRGESIYSANFQAFPILAAMGALYFVVNYVLTLASRIVERRVSIA